MTLPSDPPSSPSAMPPIGSAAAVAITPAERRRAMISVATGTVLEYFDWIIYATFAVYFAPLLFRADNLTSALLQSAAVFATGYLIRPVGAVIFGKIADRRGRKPALTLSVTLITVGTMLLAVVPTYAVVGIWSAVILVLARVLQGLAYGGEFGTVAATLREIAPPERRGRVSSIFIVASVGGNVLGFVLLLVLTAALSPAQMSSFGWRIPFAVAFAGSFVVLYLRRRMVESPVFQLVKDSPAEERGRVRELLTRENRGSLLLTFGVTALSIPIFITVTTYFQKLGVAGMGLPPRSAGTAILIALIVMAGSAYYFGWLGDRYGTATMLAIGISGAAVLVVPTYLFITQVGTATALAIGSSVLILFVSMWGAVQQTVFAALFPPHLRALGVGLATSIAVATFGGTTELVALSFARAGMPIGHFVLIGVLGLISTMAALMIRKRLSRAPATAVIDDVAVRTASPSA